MKLLLPGKGESGKSKTSSLIFLGTLFKQMKMIHHTFSHTEDDIKLYRGAICSNLLLAMKLLLSGVQTISLEIESEQAKKFAGNILHVDPLEKIEKIYNEEVAKDLQVLWQDKTIQHSESRSFYF